MKKYSRYILGGLIPFLLSLFFSIGFGTADDPTTSVIVEEAFLLATIVVCTMILVDKMNELILELRELKKKEQ